MRAINLILGQIGRWHDAEVRDTARKISSLRPHDLRHTFAFQLARGNALGDAEVIGDEPLEDDVRQRRTRPGG